MIRPAEMTESALVIPGVPVAERVHSRVLARPLACAREGVMLHYDDSARDDWSLAWFQNAQCTNGYTWLVLDDGRVVELADPGMRTPHAGACRVANANSRFYGVSAATNGLVPATRLQLDAIVEVCVALFRRHGWSASDVSARITGHDREAVWTPETTEVRGLWGKTGRKVDPTGVRRDGRAIIDVGEVRRAVARLMGSSASREGGDA